MKLRLGSRWCSRGIHQGRQWRVDRYNLEPDGHLDEHIGESDHANFRHGQALDDIAIE